MKISFLVAASTLLTAGLVQAAPTVNGGQVHFKGEFVNAACAVSSDTANQTVDLGQHRTAKITKAGDYTPNVPFQIKLVDCDTEVSKTAQFAFSGPQDATDTTLLKIHSGPSANAVTATGVGVEISDSKGKVLTPDGSVLSAAQTLIDGNNTFNFIARYKATAAAATAGQAYADANFVITYN
ncbi:type 1 fimbrial major subunit FimA [Acinetobacter rudis]|uniref:Type 1 fimbrial major subunit FimA n=1 Tax=Acinetobacter rudis TaxID=632955 RepID=A0AAW8J3P0_9GAMM|nr:type 1 fimbrial major subunit FimA [Acinetobacter rudis]MDQ8934219.1 type 1 fimbrial major subunit FimA [Acinetobacter rudis]MDQ8952624.1 type 1 fimbrial major subunit FimA [Acinetobacter rudis]MDQ9016473.1 type 1 fimbrial major subunit FimA [Acinetobacter rudis]